MANGQLDPVMRYLRRVVGMPENAGLTDSQSFAPGQMRRTTVTFTEDIIVLPRATDRDSRTSLRAPIK